MPFPHLIRAGALAVSFLTQPRLSERPLDDIGIISIPSNMKSESKRAIGEEQNSRLTFQFSSTYFWASFGSVTAYKQLLIVSIMAPDATDAEYVALPGAMSLSYDTRRKGTTRAIGKGTLTMTEGLYTRGTLRAPAVEYVYRDRSKRLQLAWHAVKQEVEPTTAVAQIERIAASFRLLRDPVAKFAEMRGEPARDAEMRAGRVVMARAMLQHEGHGALATGVPVLHEGAYLEWMADPEPRYQLLVPLGRVRMAANGSVLNRPRPAVTSGPGGRAPMAGTLGWREVDEGEWRFMNAENQYLPLPGIGARLASEQQDPAFVYFYYIATVRIEEETDVTRLRSLRWFLDGVPEVQRRWRAGTLVSPGTPERD